MPSYIAYYRVSTGAQGRSGLGLAAQSRMVAQVIGNDRLIESFTEIESGRLNTRPVLAEALAACRRHRGATLIVASFDRLARNASFLLGLRDAGVDFIAADMPYANLMTIGVMALLAEQEAEAISLRTKRALAEAKAQGTLLGSQRPGHWQGREHLRGHRVARQASLAARTTRRAQRAKDFAKILAQINHMREAGQTLRSIAETLNSQGIPSPTGRPWHDVLVLRTVRQLTNT
jgi:DNA invertase Pin-like site-specific DNA recombinase